MAFATRMPDELWLRTFSHLAGANWPSVAEKQKCLARIAGTSQLFRRCLRQHVWRQICLDENAFSQQLPKLLALLNRCPEIASLVKNLNILVADPQRGSGTTAAMKSLLGLLPKLEVIATNGWYLCPQILRLTSLRSLKVHCPSELNRAIYEATKRNGSVYPRIMSRILRIPSLRILHLTEDEEGPGGSWNIHFEDYIQPVIRDHVPTQIKDLSWIGGSESWAFVTNLLNNSKDLKRLVFHQQCGFRSEYDGFVDSLHLHYTSLTTLFLCFAITIDDDARINFWDNDEEPLELASFPCLLNLGITLDIGLTSPTKRLGDVLPPSLEHLQLSFDFERCENFSHGGSGVTDIGDKVENQLTSLGGGRLTNFKKVMVWDPAYDNDAEGGLSNPLEWVKSNKRFSKACEEVGIVYEYYVEKEFERCPLLCSDSRVVREMDEEGNMDETAVDNGFCEKDVNGFVDTWQTFAGK